MAERVAVPWTVLVQEGDDDGYDTGFLGKRDGRDRRGRSLSRVKLGLLDGGHLFSND
jgi:hypothetical protein